MNTPTDTPSGELSLSELPLNAIAGISGLRTPVTPEESQMLLRLIEIGFLPGETLRVIAHGHPGREPIAVRLGHTTFALRRFEADFIRVRIGTS